VRRAIGDALGHGPAPLLSLSPPPSSAAAAGQSLLPGVVTSAIEHDRWATGGFALPRRPDEGPSQPAEDRGAGPQATPEPEFRAPEGPDGLRPPRPLVALGQFRDTFILAVDDEGIAIVDQHVAHERVLFERTMERLTAGRLDSQRLLEPLLLDLPADARQSLVTHAPDLERLGFEIEEFGGGMVRVAAVPALLGRTAADAAVRALAQDLEGLDRGAGVDHAIKRIAATIACHAAVKANDRLTYEKMAHILGELRATAYSTVCPHGRPVMLRITRREIEKNFQRG
jgi:DNA mismatch repair protein MutL